MPFEIKARIVALGKKQLDLIPELEKRGLKVNPTELSQALSGRNQQPKILAVVSAANEIVCEWEKERKGLNSFESMEI